MATPVVILCLCCPSVLGASAAAAAVGQVLLLRGMCACFRASARLASHVLTKPCRWSVRILQVITIGQMLRQEVYSFLAWMLDTLQASGALLRGCASATYAQKACKAALRAVLRQQGEQVSDTNPL
jgi:hypothetical protein